MDRNLLNISFYEKYFKYLLLKSNYKAILSHYFLKLTLVHALSSCDNLPQAIAPKKINVCAQRNAFPCMLIEIVNQYSSNYQRERLYSFKIPQIKIAYVLS